MIIGNDVYYIYIYTYIGIPYQLFPIGYSLLATLYSLLSYSLDGDVGDFMQKLWFSNNYACPAIDFLFWGILAMGSRMLPRCFQHGPETFPKCEPK